MSEEHKEPVPVVVVAPIPEPKKKVGVGKVIAAIGVVLGIIVAVINIVQYVSGKPTLLDLFRAKPTNAHVYEVGETVHFGQWDWRVLAVENDKALLITKDVVELLPYHEKRTTVTWENCTLRAYLNGSFYNSFGEEDQARIALTHNENPNNTWGHTQGKPYNTQGGNPTNDHIFLLSVPEVLKYFPGLERTDDIYYGLDLSNENFLENYEKIRGIYKGSPFGWWLRSPGSPDTTYCSIAAVFGFLVSVQGAPATGEGLDEIGVRPALWLKLT